MSLSRKHYRAVAAIFAENVRTTTNEVTFATTRSIAEDVAQYFTADNPNFDHAKFLAACKVTA